MQIVFSHCQVGISQRRGIWHQATQVMPRSGYIGSSKLLIVQSVSAGISVKDRSNNASTCAYRLGTFCFKQLHRFCPKKDTHWQPQQRGLEEDVLCFFKVPPSIFKVYFEEGSGLLHNCLVHRWYVPGQWRQSLCLAARGFWGIFSCGFCQSLYKQVSSRSLSLQYKVYTSQLVKDVRQYAIITDLPRHVAENSWKFTIYKQPNPAQKTPNLKNSEVPRGASPIGPTFCQVFLLKRPVVISLIGILQGASDGRNGVDLIHRQLCTRHIGCIVGATHVEQTKVQGGWSRCMGW